MALEQMTALRWYTPQKELIENNGPDLIGVSRVLALAGSRRSLATIFDGN